MERIAKVPLEAGGHVLIEVYDVDQDLKRVGVGDKAAKTFEAAWDSAMPVIRSLSKRLAECGPTEAQIKFGVKVSTDLNAIIASARGEANFEVTLSWKPAKDFKPGS
jgi:hypothetical protein